VSVRLNGSEPSTTKSVLTLGRRIPQATLPALTFIGTSATFGISRQLRLGSARTVDTTVSVSRDAADASGVPPLRGTTCGIAADTARMDPTTVGSRHPDQCRRSGTAGIRRHVGVPRAGRWSMSCGGTSTHDARRAPPHSRYQRAVKAFGAPRFGALYRTWIRRGDAVLDAAISPVPQRCVRLSGRAIAGTSGGDARFCVTALQRCARVPGDERIAEDRRKSRASTASPRAYPGAIQRLKARRANAFTAR